MFTRSKVLVRTTVLSNTHTETRALNQATGSPSKTRQREPGSGQEEWRGTESRQHTPVVMKAEAAEQTGRFLRLKPAATFPSLAGDDVSLGSARDGDTCRKATQQVLNRTCVSGGAWSQSALIPVTLQLFNPPSEEKQTRLHPPDKQRDVLLARFRR